MARMLDQEREVREQRPAAAGGRQPVGQGAPTPAGSGCDAGRRIKGGKLHIAVDSE